jgi:hypothetical protein
LLESTDIQQVPGTRQKSYQGYQRRNEKMTRNLIVLGCAALLALGVSISGYAGLPPDFDGDGLADTADNCVATPNGPLAGTFSCVAQEDADQDGYGNPCDTDVRNDGGTGVGDLLDTLDALQNNPSDLLYDYNCNGGVGVPDLLRSLADLQAGTVTPGPSGLACAGSIPCP